MDGELSVKQVDAHHICQHMRTSKLAGSVSRGTVRKRRERGG